MFEHRFVSGHIAGNCQLALGDSSAILIDCSQPFCANQTIKNIKDALGGHSLERIILSHSHYDHIAALPQLHEAFPSVPIYAHPYTINVLKRAGALAVMERLCKAAENLFGDAFDVCHPKLNDFPEIIPLEDGQTFPFDDGEIKVIFTPGHTKDSVCVDFPDKKVCCLCETLGVKRPDGRMHPCFLTSCQDALDSVDKIEVLGDREIILAHMAPDLKFNENETFYDLSRSAITESSELILRLFNQGKNEEEIFQEYSDFYWNEGYRVVWPYHAFEINSRAAIKAVLRDYRSR